MDPPLTPQERLELLARASSTKSLKPEGWLYTEPAVVFPAPGADLPDLSRAAAPTPAPAPVVITKPEDPPVEFSSEQLSTVFNPFLESKPGNSQEISSVNLVPMVTEPAPLKKEKEKENEEDKPQEKELDVAKPKTWLTRLWEARGLILVCCLALAFVFFGAYFVNRRWLHSVYRSRTEIDRIDLLPADRVPAFVEMCSTYQPEWLMQMLYAERERAMANAALQQLQSESEYPWYSTVSAFFGAVFGGFATEETDPTNLLGDGRANFVDANNNGIPDDVEKEMLHKDFDANTREKLAGFIENKQAQAVLEFRNQTSVAIPHSPKRILFDINNIKGQVSDSLMDITTVYQFTPKEIDPSASLRIKDGAWDVLYKFWMLRKWANFEFAKARAATDTVLFADENAAATAAEREQQRLKEENAKNRWDGKDKNQKLSKQDYRCLCNPHMAILSHAIFVCTSEAGCKLLVHPKVVPVSEAERVKRHEYTDFFEMTYDKVTETELERTDTALKQALGIHSSKLRHWPTARVQYYTLPDQKDLERFYSSERGEAFKLHTMVYGKNQVMRTGRQARWLLRTMDHWFSKLDRVFGLDDDQKLEWLLSTQDAIYERKMQKKRNKNFMERALLQRMEVEAAERARELKKAESTLSYVKWMGQRYFEDKHTCEMAHTEIVDLTNVTLPVVSKYDSDCIRSLFDPPKLQFRDEVLNRGETGCVMHCNRMTDLMNAKWHLLIQGVPGEHNKEYVAQIQAAIAKLQSVDAWKDRT